MENFQKVFFLIFSYIFCRYTLELPTTYVFSINEFFTKSFFLKKKTNSQPRIGYSIFLCWLWNIYEGEELPSVYFITSTKHCITYLALTQLFPVLVSHSEMYTLCSISFRSLISLLAMDAFTWDKWILLAAFH